MSESPLAVQEPTIFAEHCIDKESDSSAAPMVHVVDRFAKFNVTNKLSITGIDFEAA